MVFMLIDHINTIKCLNPSREMVGSSTCIMREVVIELIENLWRYSGDCNLLGIGYEGVDVAKGVALELVFAF